jgi:uncharacterized iron-regulated protein
MKVFSNAIAVGGLANLTSLILANNQIGVEGTKVFSVALSSGSLRSLQELAGASAR